MNWDRPERPVGCDGAWEMAIGSGQAGVASETGSGAWEVSNELG